MMTVGQAARGKPAPGRRVLLAVLAVTTAVSINVRPVEAQQVQLSIYDIGEVFKIKAQKDNPTQVPIGVPISELVVGVALLFLPSIVNVLGTSLGTTSSSGSTSQVMSCPVFADAGTLLSEDSCVWAKVAGQWTSQSGMNNSAATYRMGGQKEIAPEWFLGGALGAGALYAQDGNGNTGTGQAFDGSVALKHTLGPWLLAGAVSFNTSATRYTQSGGLLQNDVSVYGGGARLRGAYDFAFTGWYLRPRVDLDLLYTNRPGFQVSGRGVALLAVDGYAKTSFVATPMVELGGRFTLGEDTFLRPYVAAGASFLPDNITTVSASFVGPLASLGGFQATTTSPRALVNVEAGLQFYRAHGVEAKVEYALSAGDGYLSQSASLRGAWHF
jgi:hypothetical protein